MKLDLMNFDISKIDLKNLNIKQFQNIKVISVSVLIVIFVLDLFVLLPLTRHINEAKNQQAKELDEFGYANKLLLKDGQLGKAGLFSLEGIDDLFDSITNLAKKNNVELVLNNNLGTVKALKGDFYLRKTLRMEITGSFKNTGAFLQDLHQLPEAILAVDSMNMSRNSKDASQIKTNMSFILFALKDEENQ